MRAISYLQNCQGDDLGGVRRYRVASALGIPFMEINGVPLRINPMQLKNAFVTPQALTKKLSQHLYFQVRASRGCLCSHGVG